MPYVPCFSNPNKGIKPLWDMRQYFKGINTCRSVAIETPLACRIITGKRAALTVVVF